MTLDLPSFSACDALVAVMVAVSASDQQMRTAELVAIERIVNHTAVFADYDIARIRAVASHTSIATSRPPRAASSAEAR